MGRRVFTAILPGVSLPPYLSTISTAAMVSSTSFCLVTGGVSGHYSVACSSLVLFLSYKFTLGSPSGSIVAYSTHWSSHGDTCSLPVEMTLILEFPVQTRNASSL